jgi:hypothetical protein
VVNHLSSFYFFMRSSKHFLLPWPIPISFRLDGQVQLLPLHPNFLLSFSVVPVWHFLKDTLTIRPLKKGDNPEPWWASDSWWRTYTSMVRKSVIGNCSVSSGVAINRNSAD